MLNVRCSARMLDVSLSLIAFATCFSTSAWCKEVAPLQTDDSPWAQCALVHKLGVYNYVPILSKIRKCAAGFEIFKDNKMVFRYLVNSKGDEYCWPVAPFASDVATTISASPARLPEDVIGDSDGPTLPVGCDVTGDGVPDLIVGEFTGGIHCCYNYHIYSLGEQIRKSGTIEGWDSQFKFKDLDLDQVFEAVGYDMNFRYWNESFASSPAPLVILSLVNGKPELSTKLMKASPLSVNELQQLARQVQLECSKRAGLENVCPDKAMIAGPVWGAMLNLIYTGNAQQAWQLYDLVWPKSTRGYWANSYKLSNRKDRVGSICNRNKLLSDFKIQITKSPYWSGLKKMNDWK